MTLERLVTSRGFAWFGVGLIAFYLTLFWILIIESSVVKHRFSDWIFIFVFTLTTYVWVLDKRKYL